VTVTLSEFEQVIYADSEFVAKPGEPPDVVCLAWREEPSGQTYRLWRDQLGDVPPYRTDARDRPKDTNLESQHQPQIGRAPANVVGVLEDVLPVQNRSSPFF
jgi:hypothetical protein